MLFYILGLIFLKPEDFFKVSFCYLLFLLTLVNDILSLCTFNDF